MSDENEAMTAGDQVAAQLEGIHSWVDKFEALGLEVGHIYMHPEDIDLLRPHRLWDTDVSVAYVTRYGYTAHLGSREGFLWGISIVGCKFVPRQHIALLQVGMKLMELHRDACVKAW